MARALLAGRQRLLLRKGGIHEKRFAVGAQRSLLFPTVAHSHAASVRPEHRDLLAPGAADSTDERVVVRCVVEVVAVVPVERPERLSALAPWHVWTDESVRGRLDFRPRQALTALVVSTRPLVRPVTLTRGPEHRGCSSWLDLDVAWPPLGEPVLPLDELERTADEVRRLVGSPGGARHDMG